MPDRRRPRPATNSWRKNGMHVAGGLARRGRRSPGTSRQPRTLRPSSAAIALDRAPRRRRARSSSSGRKAMPTAYAPGRREVEVDDRAQERVGDLGEDARAVADERVGARGAAVVEVAQGGQRVVDDVVAGAAPHRGHEGDAAGVVLVLAAVQARCRRAGRRSGRRSRRITVLGVVGPSQGTGHGKVRRGRPWPRPGRIPPTLVVLPCEPGYPTSLGLAVRSAGRLAVAPAPPPGVPDDPDAEQEDEDARPDVEPLARG